MTAHDSAISPGSPDPRGPIPGSDAAALPGPRLWLLLATADWCAPCRPAPTLLRELCRRHGSAMGGAVITLDGSAAHVSDLTDARSAARPGRREGPHGPGAPPAAAQTPSAGVHSRGEDGPADGRVDGLEISLGEPGGPQLHLPLGGETATDPVLAALGIEELPTWIALVPAEPGSAELVEKARLVGALPKHTVEASLVLPHLTRSPDSKP